mgnify:CR=1 FL=1
MRKIITILVILLVTANSSKAQEKQSDWTFNTRAWTTNYWSALIFDAVETSIKHFVFDGDKNDSLWAERIIPELGLVFPFGMGKDGFEKGVNNIYGPYHHAFGNPFKHFGDYGIGADVSYKPSFIGVYGGAYFKSQAIHYKNSNIDPLAHGSLRAYYIQPRLGIILGGNDNQFEAGAYYDAVVGNGGTMVGSDKKMLKGGLGLDFSFGHNYGHSKSIIQISLPLHNFLDTDYPGQAGMKRKVGYIMLTERVYL